MANQYSITLSRKDMALASYFPGLEIKDRPGVDWVETVLLPALLPAARQTNQKLANVPVTFWIYVGRTGRGSGNEILLSITPWRLNVAIRKAIGKSLEKIEHGNIFVGRDTVHPKAMPCCQLFRGKLIRFYVKVGKSGECLVMGIRWRNGQPSVGISTVDSRATFLESQDSEQLLVGVTTVDKDLNGGQCRKLQQTTPTIGVAKDGGSPNLENGQAAGPQKWVFISEDAEERSSPGSRQVARPGTEAIVPKYPKCDYCAKAGRDNDARYDAETQSGPWANMCGLHFALYGKGLGEGRGQRLVLRADRLKQGKKKVTAMELLSENMEEGCIHCPECGEAIDLTTIACGQGHPNPLIEMGYDLSSGDTAKIMSQVMEKNSNTGAGNAFASLWLERMGFNSYAELVEFLSQKV